MEVKLKIEQATMKRAFFDSFGQSRYFSAEFEIPPFSQSYPATTFPKELENQVATIFKKTFNTDNLENQIDCSVISHKNIIVAIVSPSGKLFNILTLMATLMPESINVDQAITPEAYKIYKELEENKALNSLSKEDKLNASIVFSISNRNQAEKAIKYYDSLVTMIELENTLPEHVGVNNKFKL